MGTSYTMLKIHFVLWVHHTQNNNDVKNTFCIWAHHMQ